VPALHYRMDLNIELVRWSSLENGTLFQTNEDQENGRRFRKFQLKMRRKYRERSKKKDNVAADLQSEDGRLCAGSNASTTRSIGIELTGGGLRLWHWAYKMGLGGILAIVPTATRTVLM
jgi:hypothetical protein